MEQKQVLFAERSAFLDLEREELVVRRQVTGCRVYYFRPAEHVRSPEHFGSLLK